MEVSLLFEAILSFEAMSYLAEVMLLGTVIELAMTTAAFLAHGRSRTLVSGAPPGHCTRLGSIREAMKARPQVRVVWQSPVGDLNLSK